MDSIRLAGQATHLLSAQKVRAHRFRNDLRDSSNYGLDLIL